MTHKSALRFEIAKLDLKPGDILVIKTLEHYSQEAIKHLVENFQKMVPNEVKGIVIDGGGFELSVIHPEAIV